MSVLVTGGAGYIGSHVVRLLRQRGDSPVVIDDLSTGTRERIGDAKLVQLDLLAPGVATNLAYAMSKFEATAVIHFAALKAAGESVDEPVKYYRHNIGSLTTVLDAMAQAGVTDLVFSSSAAVYGDAESPLTEDTPPLPVSPYGETKLAGERLVASAAHAYGLNAVSLRYFNVAGAGDPSLGDTSVNNLIPMVINRIAAGEVPQIFGDDYDTPDGTCIRDYIHVQDLAEAHLAALDHLQPGHRVYNVGTGIGSSVREIIDLVIEISGRDIQPEVVSRRPGDPDTVVASVERIRKDLGWTARHDTRAAVESAWAAHLARTTETPG